MYGFDYELEPATEGKIGDFFTAVLAKIKAFRDKLQELIKRVGDKIRRLTGRTSAEEAKQDSADAIKKIDEIGSKIADMIQSCSAQISILYAAYDKVAAGKEVEADKVGRKVDTTAKYALNDAEGNEVENGRVVKRDGKFYDVTKSYSAQRGMDKIDKSLAKNSEVLAQWEKDKEKVALALATQKGNAEKIAADLKSLASYGPLGIETTKTGYNKLRAIFNANGEFGNGWKRIKIAAEWSTGDIRTALNKVVSVYDVGVRATDAFGNRLTRGFVRNEETGEKLDKKELKGIKSEAKQVNKIHAGNKSERNIGVSRKDSNFMKYRDAGFGSKQSADAKASVANAGESASYVLDRIYQMAYEDAMEDIELRNKALETYEAIPGAYEFVDESVDPDFVLDPELDYEYDV